jgi:type IV pilus assembly protein PilQ
MKTTEKIASAAALASTGRWSVRLAALAVLAAAPVLGFAQNAIQSISNGLQGGSEVIRLEFSEPLTAVPKGFALQSPARVALDLPGVRNATGHATQEINQGNLRSLALAQGSDRTRLVLNLKQSTRYRAEIDGKTLVITLDPVSVGGATATSSATAGLAGASEPMRFADPQNTQPERLRDIDFRRGKDGAAKQPGRGGHPPAGPEPDRRVPALIRLRGVAPPAGRDRLRHTGAGRHHHAGG